MPPTNPLAANGAGSPNAVSDVHHCVATVMGTRAVYTESRVDSSVPTDTASACASVAGPIRDILGNFEIKNDAPEAFDIAVTSRC